MKIIEFAESLEKTAMEFLGLSKEEIKTTIGYGYQEFSVTIDILPVTDRFITKDSINYLNAFISSPGAGKLVLEGVSSSLSGMSFEGIGLEEAVEKINENLGTEHCKFIFNNLVR